MSPVQKSIELKFQEEFPESRLKRGFVNYKGYWISVQIPDGKRFFGLFQGWKTVAVQWEAGENPPHDYCENPPWHVYGGEEIAARLQSVLGKETPMIIEQIRKSF